MMDLYFKNKETGELLPSSQAIYRFYESHGALESWENEWTETNIETGHELARPDFAGGVFF